MLATVTRNQALSGATGRRGHWVADLARSVNRRPHVPAAKPTLELESGRDGTLRVVLAGAWRLQAEVPASSAAVRAVAERVPSRVVFDSSALSAWDGSVLALAERISGASAAR